MAVKDFKEGATSFSNRKYKWLKIPEKMADWKYVQTAGAQPVKVSLTGFSPTKVFMATRDGMDKNTVCKKPAGWNATDITFQYSGPNESIMRVYWHHLDKGQNLDVPQDNFTGGVLFLPPETRWELVD